MDEKLQKSIKNRNYIIIGLIILVVIGFGLNFSSIHESENNNQKVLKTQFFIQNSDGKILDTWKEWKPVDYVSFHIENFSTSILKRFSMIRRTFSVIFIFQKS